LVNETLDAQPEPLTAAVSWPATPAADVAASPAPVSTAAIMIREPEVEHDCSFPLYAIERYAGWPRVGRAARTRQIGEG